MIILVNGLSARLGGGQTYLFHLLKNIPQGRELKIFLLCPDNFNLEGLPANIERVEKNLKLDNPIKRTLWEWLHLGTLAERLSADVVFCPGGLLPSRLPVGVTSVITFQNMLPYDLKQRARYKFGYRRLRDWLLERGLSSAMRRADLVIFISHYAKQFILSKLGSLRGKHVVIPHGIDQRFFADEALPLSAYAPVGDYFLYVSYIDFYKSQIEVVRAFAELRKKTGTKAYLLLVGAENPVYGALLRREIASHELQDGVKLLGNVSYHELPALYQHARINLFASCTENCPNILLEIMASGKPALVSYRSPMTEFAGETVTYFNPDDPAELACAWEKLLYDTHHAQILAARAAAHVLPMQWSKAARVTWHAIEEAAKVRA